MVWGVYPQLGSLERVKADLQALCDLDLTQMDAPEPELTYLFKHIITQEVAYESLLYATRATLHEQIAQFIETTFSEALDRYVNLLAFHYEHSENEAKKREYLLKAGAAAQADYANEAAIQYFEKALPLLDPAEQVPVLLKLGKVLELTAQWHEAGQRYRQALALAEELGDEPGQAWSETATGELFRKRGEFDEALAWLQRARVRFEQLSDESGVRQVLHYAGTVADQQGDYESARALYRQSLAIGRKLDDKAAIGSLLSNLGIVARRQGDLELARSRYEESLAVRRQINDRWAIAVTLNNMGNLALDQGRPDEARARLEEAVALQQEVGDRWMIGNALNNLGNVARAQGDYREARACYNESLAIYRILGDKWALAYLFEDVACMSALQGEAQRALRLAGSASVLRQEIGAPHTAGEASKLESALQPARQVLSGAEQASTWAAGRAMQLEDAIADAFTDDGP
jgi:tetratricopeptide (TPR) repeat protein